MKLTDDQVLAVRNAIGVEPLAYDTPALDQLTKVFGEHTFYLTEDGLVIWEYTESEETVGQPAIAVMIARWTDDERTSLAMQSPQVTNVIVPLDTGTAPSNA